MICQNNYLMRWTIQIPLFKVFMSAKATSSCSLISGMNVDCMRSGINLLGVNVFGVNLFGVNLFGVDFISEAANDGKSNLSLSIEETKSDDSLTSFLSYIKTTS